jgi:PDZ domain-containing protein
MARTSPQPGEPADPAPQPGRRRARRIVALAGLATLPIAGVAAWNWPTHQYAERPGPVLDLDARVQIGGGADATTINGAFDGLTVRLVALDLGRLVVHAISDDPSAIVPQDAVRPPNIDPSVYHAYEKAAFVDGGQVAAAVAERALGYRASVTSDGLEIFQVAPDGPAAGQLSTGELIKQVDSTPITVTADLSRAVHDAGGRALVLTVTDATGTTSREVSLTPTTVVGSATPVLGVVVGEADPKIDLEIPVTVDAASVEGPSAGLLTALTIYDKLSPVDIAGGRTIAGTGTLALDGSVGDIGGIQAKARAAETAGADVFLAPADQAGDARAVLGDRIPVVGVTSFDDAVHALTGGATIST